MAQVHGVDDRPRLRRVLAAVCLISGLPAVILTCVRLLPFGLPTPFVQLISLTPYLLLPLTIAMVAAFALRWWTGGSILIAAMLLQLLWLVPAWTGVEPAAEPVSQGGSAGTSSTEVLDVMALNALYGRAEAGPIVKTAREQGIDVLVIAEFDKDLSRRLDAAGISGPLPYSKQRAEQGPGGSAIYSRFPLQDVREIPGTAFSMQQVSVLVPVTADDAVPVQVTAVHTYPPFPGEVHRWRDDLRTLAGNFDDGKLQIFMGDFNATIDHAQYRQLLNAGTEGLFDAAAAAESRLHPTWPVGGPVPPILTLDHIVASTGFGLAGYRTKTIPGTDHKAVIGHLTMPSGTLPQDSPPP